MGPPRRRLTINDFTEGFERYRTESDRRRDGARLRETVRETLRNRRYSEANMYPLTPEGLAEEERVVGATLDELRRLAARGAAVGAQIGSAAGRMIPIVPNRLASQIVGGAIGAGIGLLTGVASGTGVGAGQPMDVDLAAPPPPTANDMMVLDTGLFPVGMVQHADRYPLIDLGRRIRKKHKRSRLKLKEDIVTWRLRRKRRGVRRVIKK